MRARPGVALILVLWVIVIFSTVAATLSVTARSETRLAQGQRARVLARYAAESGVTLATATVERHLHALADSASRRAYLNLIEQALQQELRQALGAAEFAVTLVDVNARLDVNLASAESLARLFSYFTDPNDAAYTARAIRQFIGGDSLGLQARFLDSLDELERVPGVRRSLLERAAPYLTVDGDGTINRATATDTVLSVAAGDLRDEPSRILVISRGWPARQSLTHEVQAVFGVQGNELRLIRWRERTL